MVFPFPGVNPYLEHPAIWLGVHHWLIIGLAGYLSPQLRPHYRIAVEVRMYVAETIKQGYLEVREVSTGQVITAIEILSPVNKRTGKGRQQYEAKRNRVLNSQTHLVEIDLLREGKPMLFLGDIPESDYRILVSRGDSRPQADPYAFNLPAPIPVFPLPLKASDKGPCVDLNRLLQTVYDQGSFDLAIDYTQQPYTCLSEKDEVWLNHLLIEQGFR